MKRIIALNKPPLLIGADENLFLETLAYHDRGIEEEPTLIETTRKQMARIIRTLKPEQLEQTGCHNERGLMTLERVIQTAINHIPHHLKFTEEKRKALGI